MGRILSLTITLLLLASSTTAQSTNITDSPVVAPVFAPITVTPTTAAPIETAETPPPTDAPVTPLPTTGMPVTPMPVTPMPITAMPITPVPTDPPLTEAPSAAPVTAQPVTAQPVTAQPTTAAPMVIITESPSGAPVTAQPITSQPVTSQPVTFAPVLITEAPVVPTDAPIVAATAAPVAATAAPVVATIAPTTASPITLSPVTATPSLAPITTAPSIPDTTFPPSVLPTTPAPITPAPVTAAPVTSAPIDSTSLPSFTQPSNLPSFGPSSLNSVPPSASAAPSAGPDSADPSVVPSTMPSPGPVTVATLPPTFERFTAEPFQELSMIMTSMTTMSPEQIQVWEEATTKYVQEFDYAGSDVAVSGVVTIVEVTGQSLSNARRLGRSLQQDSLTISYTQKISYLKETANVTPRQVVEAPFFSAAARLDYITVLKETDDPAFDSLINTSNVRVPEAPEEPDSGGLGTGAIIGIVVGSICGLILLCGVGYYMHNKSQNRKGYFSGVGDNPPLSISKAGGDDVSTLAEPAKMGVIPSGESLAGYGEQSVATVDYDYSKAYGGGADHSVSSAGGTFGSNPQAHGANQDAAVAAGAATLGSFSDDGSFGEAGGAKVREELIDIYAPAGKLGVVIDTPDDGAPVVHAIKDSSVIADKLQVGDKLVAVDDEDVRTMTAIKVSKLISRKSGNPTRKLSIIRTSVAE